MLHTRNKNTSVPISHPSQHSTITKTHYQKPNNQSQQLRSESKDSKKIIIKDKKEKERHTLLWEKKNGERDEHRGSEWSFNLGAGGWYILVSFFYVFLFSFCYGFFLLLLLLFFVSLSCPYVSASVRRDSDVAEWTIHAVTANCAYFGMDGSCVTVEVSLSFR